MALKCLEMGVNLWSLVCGAGGVAVQALVLWAKNIKVIELLRLL